MASDPITSGNKEIEAELRGLQPSALGDDLLDRLEAVTDGSLTSLSEADLHFEQSLRAFSPAGLSGDFLARLEDAVSGVPFPATEKIVLFPKTAPLHKTKTRPSYRPWAAAAAVALIGGISALLIPQGGSPRTGTIARQAPANPLPSQSIPYSGNIAPASTNTRGDVQDMGISWHDANQPHRVLRLNVTRKVVVRNADGSVMEIEQPQPEYIMIPEKMD